MGLKLTQFSEYVQGGTEIDYFECRLGEQYVLPFTVTDDMGNPIDITGWSFTVTSTVYTASFCYSGTGVVTKSSLWQAQLPEQTIAGLQIVDINYLAGTGTLTIPAAVNPDPTVLVSENDETNTMVNVITIKCEYPSGTVGFPNKRNLLIGLIVRLGN